jgi:hypothetical protein
MVIALGKPSMSQTTIQSDREPIDKLSSIIFMHHPAPLNISDLKGLFAMVNYLF